MMYEELIKDLRENHDKYFARDMEAADAIEELQKDLERLRRLPFVPMETIPLPGEKDQA